MITICFICDNNYVLPTVVAINSLVKTQKEKLKIYVIGIDLSDENAIKFESFLTDSIQVEVIRQENCYNGINISHPYLTQAAFMKFQIANILSDDKVLYLDGDIVVTCDLYDFYNTDLENSFAAVVKDLVAENEEKDNLRLNLRSYFNSGVMLLNLRKIRDDNIVKQLSDYASHDKVLKYADQDAFNVVLKDNIVYSDYKWNYLNVYEIKGYEELKCVTNKGIVHYAGLKPWNNPNFPLSDLWLKYLPAEDLCIVFKRYLANYDREIKSYISKFFSENSASIVNNFNEQLFFIKSQFETLKPENTFLTFRVRKLKIPPSLYKRVKSNNLVVRYFCGIPVYKRKDRDVYVFGLHIWRTNKK